MSAKSPCSLFYVVIILTCLLACEAAAELRYQVIDLGPPTLPGWPGGSTSAINSLGQVAGSCFVQQGSKGAAHSFFWDGGLSDIGIPFKSYAIATGLNDLGEVVGQFSAMYYHAFVWRKGSLIDLETLPEGRFSAANAINNQGTIVGYGSHDTGTKYVYRACKWENGVPSRLSGLNEELYEKCETLAYDINDKGQIVGIKTATPGGLSSFIWENGNVRYLDPLPGSNFSLGYRINNNGDVVGFAFTSQGASIVLWRNGVPTDLGPGYGTVMQVFYALNDNGDVLGPIRDSSSTGFTGPHRLMLFSKGQWKDLNSLLMPGSVWKINYTGDINNRGEISANGLLASGVSHAVLLKPIHLVRIDIRPGEEPNVINMKSKGNVAVAILASEDLLFDDLDFSSLRFAGAQPDRWEFADIDSNGVDDAILHFRTQEMQILPTTTEVALTGATFTGVQVQGSDSVQVKGNK